MSTPKDYRRCLEQLAAAPPKRKAPLIRSLLPGIEAALSVGQSLKDIWEALKSEGLQVSYHTFHMAVWRARRKQTAPIGWKKQDGASDPEERGLAETGAIEERDPLANLKRLEESRPGFQWRGTEKVKRLAHETEDSNDKNKR
jgi:hypothetical protein